MFLHLSVVLGMLRPSNFCRFHILRIIIPNMLLRHRLSDFGDLDLGNAGPEVKLGGCKSTLEKDRTHMGLFLFLRAPFLS